MLLHLMKVKRVCQWLRDSRNKGGWIYKKLLSDKARKTKTISKFEGSHSIIVVRTFR